MSFQGRDNDMKFNVCPSDRQLALRAKLRTGWSTGKTTATSLDPAERDAIIGVVQRNELLENAERERIGRIIERVEKIKQRVVTDFGPKNCRLCGQGFGLLSPSKIICQDCRKPVCSKCSVELHVKHGTNLRDIWLCHICAETREMWKKTGAWFYKSLPSYSRPLNLSGMRSASLTTSPRPERKPHRGIKVNDSSSDDDDDEYDNDNEATTTIRCSSVSTKRSSSYFLEKLSRSKPCQSTSSLNEDGFFYRKLSSLNLFGRSPSSLRCDTDSNHSSFQLNESGTGAGTGNGNGNGTTSMIRRNSELSTGSTSETSSSINDTHMATVTINSISNHAVREQPMGWLDVSLTYCEMEHTLDCFLLRARDLPSIVGTDLTCPPDPFCRLNIVTQYDKLKQNKWLQTKTVHKTRCPEFNETVRFFGVEPDELATSTLYVVILDDDKYGSDFLGTAKVYLGPMAEPGSHRMSFPLCIQDRFCVEASSLNHQRGSILIALCYNTKRRSLAVQVKRCIGLLPMDNNGFSDPFVKLQLKPDSHRNKKHKTSVKWRNLNPVFNEEFYFETRPNELDKQSLIITVWDKDLGKSNDFLGSLVIGYASKGKRLKQWKDCIRLPDCFHDQWHYLANDPHPHPY